MSVEIEIVEDPARACSAMMVGAASGGGHVVLTGGGTPGAAYRQFVTAVGAVGVDLTASTFWFGDERCVPPDDERSNYRMADGTLFSALAAGNRPAVMRMRGELGPEEGAAEYAEQLGASAPEQFDLLLLGIGPDGHVASMFPGQATLQERSAWVLPVPEAGLEPFVPRITLTLAAIGSARRVVVLATGGSKADAVGAAFGPGARPDPQIPASMLRDAVDELTVLIDPAAAAKL